MLARLTKLESDNVRNRNIFIFLLMTLFGICRSHQCFSKSKYLLGNTEAKDIYPFSNEDDLLSEKFNRNMRITDFRGCFDLEKITKVEMNLSNKTSTLDFSSIGSETTNCTICKLEMAEDYIKKLEVGYDESPGIGFIALTSSSGRMCLIGDVD